MHTQKAVEVEKKGLGLKAERVQDVGMSLRLKAERVQELLTAIPEWRLTGGGTTISRTYRFAEPRSATAYAMYIRELAAGENQPAAVSLTGSQVRINLTGRPQLGRARYLTEAEFRFAARLG